MRPIKIQGVGKLSFEINRDSFILFEGNDQEVRSSFKNINEWSFYSEQEMN